MTSVKKSVKKVGVSVGAILRFLNVRAYVSEAYYIELARCTA